MFNSVHVKLLRQSAMLSKVLLAALHLETRATGQAEALMAPVHARAAALCKLYSLAPGGGDVPLAMSIGSAATLGSQRLILCDPIARRLHMRLSLNVATDDLLYVLAADETLPEALRNQIK